MASDRWTWDKSDVRWVHEMPGHVPSGDPGPPIMTPEVAQQLAQNLRRIEAGLPLLDGSAPYPTKGGQPARDVRRPAQDSVLRIARPTLAYDPMAQDKGEFKETEHPRGKPKNKGQFAKKGQAVKGSATAKAPKLATPKAPKAAARAKPLPAKKPAKEPAPEQTELYASPSIASGLNLRVATQRLDSRRERALSEISGQIDSDLGIKNSKVTGVVGAWADGAENSMMVVHDSADPVVERAAAAMKGYLANQKAVLLFHPDAHGPDSMMSFVAQGPLEAIHRTLLEHNIPFHTLEPRQLTGQKAESVVHILNQGHDQDMTDRVSAAAQALGGNRVKVRAGGGSFIGTTQETGSDADQRADARRAYLAEISAAVEHGRRDIGERWQNYLDRWGTLVGHEDAPGPPGTIAKGTIDRPPLPGSAGGDANQISTRRPTRIGAVEDDQYRRIDLAAERQSPELFVQHMDLMRLSQYYPNLKWNEFPPAIREPAPPAPTGNKTADKLALEAHEAAMMPGRLARADKIARAAVDHMKANLEYLYQIAPQEMKEQAHLWYEGAHGIAQRKAEQYKLPFQSVAGVYAALSPQKLWDMNVYLGDNVINIHQTQQNHAWDAEMETTARRLWKSDRLASDYAAIRGKTLSQCESAVEKAMWIRTYGEAHIPKAFNALAPSGEVIGPYVFPPESPRAGENVAATWQSTVALANAVRCLESGGDRNVISASLGNRHKVRSFYNNILDPHSPNKDVTIDTHAVGAALLRPLGGSHVPVMHNLATNPGNAAASAEMGFESPTGSSTLGISGTYALYAQAYRELAEKLKIEPRTLQSITWEAKRRLMGNAKPSEKAAIERAWQDYHSGYRDLATTQANVVRLAGGAEKMNHAAVIDPYEEEQEDGKA